MLYPSESPIQNTRELQTLLRAISYYDPSVPSVTSDGIYGPRTEASVRAFQKLSSLPETGSVDYATWRALIRAHEEIAAANQPGDPVYPLLNPHRLQSEMPASFYAMLQLLLMTVSAKTNFTPPVRLTGQYDNATSAAVAAVQTAAGLQPTGTLDLPVWNIIVQLYNLEIREQQSTSPDAG